MKGDVAKEAPVFKAFRALKSVMMKAIPFSRAEPKAGTAQSQAPKRDKVTLAEQGKRLLAMAHRLQLSAAPCAAAAAAPASAPTVPAPAPAAPAPAAPAPQPAAKRLFSAADLQGVALRGKAMAAAAVTSATTSATVSRAPAASSSTAAAAAAAAAKPTARPFSALDLSRVQLRRKSSSGAAAKASRAAPSAGGAAAKATPLHEQLKRALQRKFMRVRATPAADADGDGDDDDAVEVDEWA